MRPEPAAPSPARPGTRSAGQRHEHLLALRRLGALRREGPVHEPQLGPAGLQPPTPHAPSAPDEDYIEGIDVSHWQGTIDWVKVAGAGKKFAFIKATESTDFLDNVYATNRAKAKANGLKVGAYHFARPGTNTNDAVERGQLVHPEAGPDLRRAATRSSTSSRRAA